MEVRSTWYASQWRVKRNDHYSEPIRLSIAMVNQWRVILRTGGIQFLQFLQLLFAGIRRV